MDSRFKLLFCFCFVFTLLISAGCIEQSRSSSNTIELTPNAATTATFFRMTYWLNDSTSTITDFDELLLEPNTAIPTTSHSVSVKAADGLVLLDKYITPPLGVTMIKGNEWRFFNYGQVSALTGSTKVVIFGRLVDSTGKNLTTLFTTVSEPYTIAGSPQYIQSRVAVGRIPKLNATDRFIVAYYVNTTSSAAVNVDLFHNGQEYYTHFTTYT